MSHSLGSIQVSHFLLGTLLAAMMSLRSIGSGGRGGKPEGDGMFEVVAMVRIGVVRVGVLVKVG